MILLDIFILCACVWIITVGPQYIVRIIGAKILIDETVILLNEINLGELQPLLKTMGIITIFTGTLLLAIYILAYTNRKKEDLDA